MHDKDWAEAKAKELETTLGDKELVVTTILGGLDSKDGNCPCIPEYNHNADTLCPCKSMREQGTCKCGLFKSKQ